MKKKLTLVLTAVVGMAVVFSGCNLFVTDKKAYYNQTIASITTSDGTNLSINKEELMQAYNRYASTLEDSGYSGKDLVDKLVDTLIDQKFVINETTKLIAEGKITVSNSDKNEMWTDTYESVLNLIEDYEEEVAEDWGMDTPTNPEADDDDVTKYEKYQPEAKIVKVAVKNGEETTYEYKIQIVDNEGEVEQALISDDPVNSIIAKVDEVKTSKVSVEAKKRYIADLKNYQEGRGFSTDNATVWKNEVQRIYDNVKDNKYISLYTEYVETVKAEEAGSEVKYSVLSVNDIMKYLEQNVKHDYVQYTSNIDLFKTDILENRKNVDYIVSNDETGKYFYVSHILVKFADGQFDDLKALRDNGYITQAEYDAQYKQLVNDTVVKEYGKEVSGYTVSDLYNDFSTAINNAVGDDKFDVFNDFMYKYNEDTGNKNQDYDYIVGTKDSKMVDSFTEAARNLYDNGNGQVGAISGMVESEYGVHILIYLGEVKNDFEVSDIDNFTLTGLTGKDLDEQVRLITNAKLSNLNDKTIFDKAYEALKSDNSSVLQNLNVNTLKSGSKITIYHGHYTDLY